MTTTKQAGESADRRAIAGLGDALRDAWNRGDAAAFASPFTDDASFVAWNGLRGYGRSAIEDAHRPLLTGPLAGSQLVMDAESLRFVRPDVAIMVTTGAVTLAGQSATEADHESVQTFVLTRNGDGWQIAAFHNTRRPRPALAADAPDSR